MARLYLKKTLTGFSPADEPSRERWGRYKVGEIYRADIVRPRNYQHHKLIMALLSMTYEHLPEKIAEICPTFKSFRRAVAAESGHTDEWTDLHGVVHVDPRSISYDEVPDDVDFGAIAAGMMTVCARILEVEESELAQEVARYADEHYGRG